jgi:DMSO reductase family type II enzyme chaperone
MSNQARLRDTVESDPAARGGVYALGAKLFVQPDAETFAALETGAITEQFEALLAETTLDVSVPDLTTDDDHDTLCARYNDLFVIGFSEVVDRTDGTIDSQGPPVSLYESDYRPEASWADVNLDLARAYEYFGLGVDDDTRDNHDHVRLQLEFMGYLCRREAAVDSEVAAARLDFLDRHLKQTTEGVAAAIDEQPGTDVYGPLSDFLARFTAADVDALAARIEDGDGQ